MEEKKLSKVLDEIFGSYISNETETIEKINDYPAPLDLNNFIENLFLSKDIANNDLMFNSIPNIKPDIRLDIKSDLKFDIKPNINFTPAASPLEKVLPKENEKIKAKPQFNNVYDETLPMFQQAYIAGAVCNQLCELLIGYSRLFKFSKKPYRGMPVLKNQIMEIMRMAEYIYRKTAGKPVCYANVNINFNSYNCAIAFIRNKTIETLGDIAILKDNTIDLEIKRYLVHIERFLRTI